MKIGIVIEPYEEYGASGMSFFLTQLVSHLLLIDNVNTYVLFCSTEITSNIIPGKFTQVYIPKGALRKMWWFFNKKLEVDVLMFVSPLLALYPAREVKTILFCQELPNQRVTPELFLERVKEGIRDKVFMQLTVARASVITSPSRATEKDILKGYRKAEGKTKVIPHGFKDFSSIISASDLPNKVRVPFFLFTGRVKPRKNVQGIVSAFIDYRLRVETTTQLVISGWCGRSHYNEMMLKLEQYNLQNEVHFIGFVTDQELHLLYKKCTAFLFLSLSEGFGMPILEAMSLSAPVVTSSISSMPEVASDAALCVDPYSINDMSEAFERIENDKVLRVRLMQKGRARAKEYSWEKCAQDFLNVIATVKVKNSVI